MAPPLKPRDKLKDKGNEAGKRLVRWTFTLICKSVGKKGGNQPIIDAFEEVGCYVTDGTVRKWFDRGFIPLDKGIDLMTIGLIRDIPELRHLDNVRRICSLPPHDKLRTMKKRRRAGATSTRMDFYEPDENTLEE